MFYTLIEFFEQTEPINNVGFRNIYNNDIITILPAKSTQRYRLQTDSFVSLSLLVEQLIQRLRKHYENLIITTTLPTNLEYIENHFETRQKYTTLQTELLQMSAQYRLIQKRLISKLKMKNPTPLNNLELLLKDTFNEIMNLTIQLEEESSNLSISQIKLSCALKLIVNLIKLGCNDQDLLETTFSPFIYDLEGQVCLYENQFEAK